MKTPTLLSFSLLSLTALAGPPEQPKIIPPPPPPTYVTSPPAPAATPVAPAAVYGQQVATPQPVLVSADQARTIIDKFKAAYPKLGNPRILVYVNRELVDDQSGVRLTSKSEKNQTTRTDVQSAAKGGVHASTGTNQNQVTIASGGGVTVVGDATSSVPGEGKAHLENRKSDVENTYRYQERPAGTLADRQMVRDLERAFGRPLRMAGAKLADQRVATQLIGEDPLKTFSATTEGSQARKDREALKNIADVALEVLISSHNITMTEVSGDKVYNVPDIQATAIRLSDARVLGQSSASDVLGNGQHPGNLARLYDTRAIAEATALALMEDMLLNVENP